jgi:hypothetical protein
MTNDALDDFFLKRWMTTPIDEKIMLEDAWTLSKGICHLAGKTHHHDLEFGTQQWVSFLDKLDNLMKDDPSPPFSAHIFVFKMLNVYQIAQKSIEGEVLDAMKSTQFYQGASFTQYWVKPVEFLLWVYVYEIPRVHLIDEIIKQYLPKRPGRPPIREDEQLVELLVDLSQKPQYQNYSAARLIKLGLAKPAVDKLLKSFSGNLDHKLRVIARKVSDHPNFGGKKNQKKSKKS